MKRINILHVTPLLTIGGAEKKLMYLLYGLGRSEFSQHVIYAISGNFEDEIKKKGIPRKRIYPMSLINPLSVISVLRIYRYIKKYGIHIVHCHLDVAYILASLAALIARVPVIFSFQNIADERVIGYYRVLKYVEKFISLFTGKIIVESEEVKKVLLSWGIKQGKLIVIPNGVEVPDSFKTAMDKSNDIRKKLGVEGHMLVGNMARLVDFKNHKLLLNVAVKVINKKPEVRFLLIGDGPLRENLIAQSQKLQIDKNIIFLGTVMDFEPYLKSFNLFVLSSYTESTPMALLHALAYGVPVISTAVGDIPSIIQNNMNGILVPSDDADAMTSAILDLLDNNDKREMIAYAGWNLAKEKYSVQKMVDEIQGVYLDAVKNRPVS